MFNNSVLSSVSLNVVSVLMDFLSLASGGSILVDPIPYVNTLIINSLINKLTTLGYR